MRKLKEVLRQQIERAGEKANPAAIESAYTRLCRDRDIRQTLAAIRGAGAAVEHHALDVSDEKAFAELIDAVYARHGRLDGVIHGAGVTEDKFITDKTLESFGRVVRPKVDGGLTLASKLRFESLKFLFFFSSVSARYGNRGQCDYAAANEVLNKLACRLDGRTPARIASLNWGPWESSGGMVSAELAKQFAKAGIQLIARPAGRRAFMDELMYGRKGDVEVIFGGPLNVPTGRSPRPSAAAPSYPLVNGRTHITRGADGSIEAVRELDPAFDLYLLDHQLDGRPVMPMAMGLELLVEVASSGREGLQVARVRDLRVLRGVTLDNGPQPLRIWASPKLSTDGPMSLDLRAETLGDRPHLCYTAVVEFGSTPLAPPHLDPLVLTEAGPFRMSVEEAYEQWLFHGPLFAGITEIVRIGENGIIARLSPSSPRRCLSEAMDVGWLIDPVIIDSGLQLLILWARTYLDMTPLPSRFGCFHRYGDLSSGENRCEVRIRSASAGHPTIHADLMFRDSAGKLVGYLEDMEVTCSKALNRLSGTRTGSAGAKS
jgi:NAD(P)-dependent dehydrogenase (short-subunit alcohol dehydrogenase family)